VIARQNDATSDASSASAGNPADGPERIEFISFAIGNDQYGVAIMSVREIKGWSGVTHLPRQPDYVRGVLNLRGVMVPIIDLRCRFGQGMTDASPMHVVIIIQIGEQLVGLLADRVLYIVSFESSEIRKVPKVGTAAYLQAVAPKVDFRDCAQVVQTAQRVCVPVRCFDKVLVIDEWAPLDPEGGHQLKYYAPRVGNIKVGAVGGDTPEVLELTQWQTLSGKDLATVHKQALAQDHRGYQVSPKVYGRTQPAQR